MKILDVAAMNASVLMSLGSVHVNLSQIPLFITGPRPGGAPSHSKRRSTRNCVQSAHSSTAPGTGG